MRKSLVPTVVSVLVACVPAAAQQPRSHPVTWSLDMMTDVRSGDSGASAVAALEARIESGWHLYSLTQPTGGPRATVIVVLSDPPFRLAGAIGRPAPDTIPDRTTTGVSEVYTDSVRFRLPIGTRSLLRPGRRPLVIAVTYQVCSARLCLAPRTDSLEVSATVVP